MAGLCNGSRIDWHEYFMGIAILSAKRTAEHCYPVGACIVNNDKIVVGTGYNGLPKGCNSKKDRSLYVWHAELTAIQNKNSRDVKGCIMYVTMFPCNQCANIIIQSGIQTVIYCNKEHNCDTKRVIAAKKMFDAAGVVFQEFSAIYNKLIPKDKYMRLKCDEYFLGIAHMSSKRSKSIVKKVGACVVNNNNVIVGIGYNGLSRGLDYIPINFAENIPASYFEVCHAEINAILNNSCDVKDCTMYVTSFPCNECAKVIIQFGITTVIYIHEDTDKSEVAKKMFDTVGVKYRQCDVNIAKIEIFK